MSCNLQVAVVICELQLRVAVVTWELQLRLASCDLGVATWLFFMPFPYFVDFGYFYFFYFSWFSSPLELSAGSPKLPGCLETSDLETSDKTNKSKLEMMLFEIMLFHKSEARRACLISSSVCLCLRVA